LQLLQLLAIAVLQLQLQLQNHNRTGATSRLLQLQPQSSKIAVVLQLQLQNHNWTEAVVHYKGTAALDASMYCLAGPFPMILLLLKL